MFKLFLKPKLKLILKQELKLNHFFYFLHCDASRNYIVYNCMCVWSANVKAVQETTDPQEGRQSTPQHSILDQSCQESCLNSGTPTSCNQNNAPQAPTAAEVAGDNVSKQGGSATDTDTGLQENTAQHGQPGNMHLLPLVFCLEIQKGKLSHKFV